MIRTKDIVPKVYYSESRDFQLLGRVFEILFNYNKLNNDLILSDPLSRNANSKLIDLLATTIGFNPKHTYNNEDLAAICQNFVNLIRQKGSITAIENAIKILLNRQGINIGEIDMINMEEDDYGNKLYNLIIYIPQQLNDTIILEDLFDYILPAGWNYRFINYMAINLDDTNTKLAYSDKDTKAVRVNGSVNKQITEVKDGKTQLGSEIYTSVVAGRQKFNK